MDDLDYGTKVFVVFVPVVFECHFSFKKQPNDVLGGMDVLEFVCRWMFG